MKYSILKHLDHIIISGDSFFGVLFGGINYDNTISSTIGAFKKFESDSKYWEVLRWIVDSTFWFIEGKGHCEAAFHNDPNEKFYVMSKTGLFVVTSVGCMILSIIFIIIRGFSELIKFIK
jgi:hypothetical protein